MPDRKANSSKREQEAVRVHPCGGAKKHLRLSAAG
jgi:hypothetical protein